MKPRALSLNLACAVACIGFAAVGCTPSTPTSEAPSAAAPTASPDTAPSPGVAAVERFMETWNSRDPELWASSLHFPHTRPAAGSHRVWPEREQYAAELDYASVIATGWDHTELEALRVIHEGNDKAHIAGRWGRVDADGNKIRRNQVSYIATRIDGQWGIQARFGAGAPLADEEAAPIAATAIAKVEQYMAAFNARDPAAWAATLNYPHLRIASGELQVWESEEQYAAYMDFDAFAERFGWDHSEWDEIEAVQVAENGVNVALTFSRYNADDEVLATFNTLYLVTNENGRWGVRARSSFAP